MVRRGDSIWKFLLTMLTAAAMTVAVLPGCGDDTIDNSDDSDSDSDSFVPAN